MTLKVKGGHGTNFKKFWKNNTVFGAFTLAAGLINYLYHVVLAHVLGPGSYGNLATFLNVTAFMVIPASVVVLLYTRIGTRPNHARQESMMLWSAGVFLWALIWIFSSPLAQILHVSRVLLIIFTAEVLPSLALAANIGILQRAQWFLWVGILGILNTGFRVFAALAALWSPYRLLTVGLLEGIAAWVAWGASRFIAARVKMVGVDSDKGLVAGTAAVGIINVLLSLGDGLIAKHSLPAVAAGQYNGLATIGHSLQFLSGSLGMVMLTSIIADNERKLKYLAITTGTYVLLGLLGEWLFIAYGSGLVMAVLGHRFLAIVPWLPIYGWGMMALGIINFVMLYSVALERWEVIISTTIGLVYWIWVLMHVHHVVQLVYRTTEIMVGILMGTLIILVGISRWGRNRQIKHWRPDPHS